MSQVPDAQLENLSPSDRNLLDKKLSQRLTNSTAFFVPIVIAAAAAIWYVNTSTDIKIEDNTLGFLNLLLVIIALLPGRLYVNQVIAFFKDKNSFQKKIYRGTVAAIDGGVVTINSYELKIGKAYAGKLQKGMQAEVHLSMNSNIVLSIIATHR